MGTTATPQAPGTDTNASQPIVTEREDYTVGFNLSTDKDNKVSKEPTLKASGSEEAKTAIQKLISEGKFEEVFTVTTSLPLAKTDAGMNQICPDEEERVANFNRGARQKASNRLKAVLLDTNADGEFTFSEDKLTNGVYDQTEDIASPSRRKILTEEEKLDRFLEQFPEAVRNSMKQAYASAKSVPVAA